MSKAGLSVVREKGGDSKSVLQIARKVAATIGADFFRAIAKSLADALAADCVLIAEFVGGQSERYRTLAAWMDGEPAHFEYDLAASAGAQLLLGKPCLWRNDVRTRFPEDQLLADVGAQACIAVPLVDEQNNPIGALVALYRRPVPSLRVPKAMLGIFADRASAELNRKRQEDKARETEERYRAFIARNADAMWRIEFEQPIRMDLPEEEQLADIYRYGYLAEGNDALARLLGRERGSQLIGARVEEIAPISDRNMREATLTAIRAGYQLSMMETHPIDAHGNQRHLLRSVWGIVEDGKLERIWGSNRDITDLRRSELAEQRMAHLLENARLMVVFLDPEGRITYCNRYVYELTGFEQGQLIGKEWIGAMFPSGERSKVLAEFARWARHPEAPIHFESTLPGRDNRRLQISWDSALLKSDNPEFAGRANIGLDVTDYKALEEQFRQAQKLAGLGRLAGGMAHDFNNMLTVILGYSTALLAHREESDPAYSSLLEIRQAAERGAEVTSRLLAFSRRQVLRPQVLDLNAIVKESLGLLRPLIGDNIQIETVLEPELGLVRVDGGNFHQVLINLAANARDVMPGGGTLTISTANVTAASQPAADLPPGDYVLLTVADTGTGMTDEVCSHIFEPFYTTKEPGKGTGLGLSMVYGTVQQSGGHIAVETEPGTGARFRIYLPRVQAELTPQPEAHDHRPLPGGAETILVVEDRDDVRRLTAGLLSGLGYSVIEADGPASALKTVEDPKRTVHLMLSDVLMPGMSSDELADRVRALRPGIRVLFASGGGRDFTPPKRVSETGFGYLAKPFGLQELADAVRSLLDKG
jgi:two-component system, cell cycle sensor histidine kinase and response regulator CckA